MADALHDLGDSLALGVSWYLDKKSKKKGDKQFTFGYRRFSLLGALINGIVLVAGSVIILSETIPRLLNPEYANAKGMLAFAIVGILVNGVAALRLRKGKTLNERMVSWHLLEDVLGWVAVLIVSIVLLFKDIPILDPILSLIILAYVLFNVIRYLRKTFLIFLQAVPEGLSIMEIENRISKIEGVQNVHHTHLWSMDGEEHVVSLHAVVDAGISVSEMQRIKKETKTMLSKDSITHVTVELEFANEECFDQAENENMHREAADNTD